MVSAELGQILQVVAVSFATAAFTLAGAAGLVALRRPRARPGAPVSFLFRGESLVDASPAAQALIAAAPGPGSERERLLAWLGLRFPALDPRLFAAEGTGRADAEAADGSRLVADWRDGAMRLDLAAPPAATAGEAADAGLAQVVAAVEAENAALRAVADAGPVAIWKQDADGAVIWANAAYLDLAEKMVPGRRGRTWPPPALFPLPPSSVASGGAVGAPVRLPLDPDSGRKRWFDCYGHSEGPRTVCFALPADALVMAEESLRTFVATMTKTFADLPIGLAVFDRSRRLTVFNPALMELTTLGIEFLLARPTLSGFLDALRDRRRLPEPRDYASWRARLAAVEAAAAEGMFRESWTLPGGQMFRVTGRPHADGAIAFLIEDVSAEISLTRRFRSEIELGQTVIDSFEEAIAVFSPGGVLTFSNTAYSALWGVDPSTALAETGIVEATRLWQSLSCPTPVWGDLRDFISDRGERVEWSETVALADGRMLTCRFQPLSGGATLVGFVQAARPPRAAARPRRRRAVGAALHPAAVEG